MLRKKAFGMLALGAVVGSGQLSLAGFGTLGSLNNDGTSLTFIPSFEPLPLLDQDPFIAGFDLPRGFGSWYFGAGETHDGDPLDLWDGAPADVGLEITHIMHDGAMVLDGFRIAVGELGAFNDVFVLGIAPTDTAGLGETMLVVDADSIAAAQTGDPTDPDYENHHHVYFQADAPGTWEVTFQMVDLSDDPIYGDSEHFTLQFIAVPEPTMVGLLLIGAMASCRRR